VQSTVEPAANVTLPEGVPPEPLTTTEYVTRSPNVVAVGVTLTAGVVAVLTSIDAVPDDPAKLASPE
jgi:hypothetical protein